MTLTKQRIETIVTSLLLVASAAIIHLLANQNILHIMPWFSMTMLTATAVYTFGGCVLQTFNRKKMSLALGVIVFFMLCVCLFYSVAFLDYVVFGICMAQVIRKSVHTCECMPKCDNPFR